MVEKPRCRWFRFSLRTLFVLIGVLCLWLGYVTNQVRERRAALAELQGRGAAVVTVTEWSSSLSFSGMQQPIPEISPVRRWFGDEAIQSITYYTSYKLSARRLGREGDDCQPSADD